MTERELQALVNAACDDRGLLWHHCKDSRYCQGPRGFLDHFVTGPGGLLVAELKGPDTRWSLEQIRWKKALLRAGIDVIELRPEQWEDGTIGSRLDALRQGGSGPARSDALSPSGSPSR